MTVRAPERKPTERPPTVGLQATAPEGRTTPGGFLKPYSEIDLSTHVVRLLFLGLVVGFAVFIIYGITALSLPILLAFLLTFLLRPFVDFLEGLGLPRLLGVIIALLLLGGATYVFFSIAIPRMIGEMRQIAGNMDQFETRAAGLLATVRKQAAAIAPGLTGLDKLNMTAITALVAAELEEYANVALTALPGLFTFALITPIILVIFLLQGGEIFRNVLSMVPNRYFEMALLVVFKLRQQMTAYLRGLVFQWAILATIFIGGFSLVGLPYAPLIGFLAATVNIIPYLGPVLGLIPALLVAMMAPGGSLVLPALLVVGTAQLVDNVFNQPVVLARSVQLHPLIAVLAFITFQELLGVVGMLIAIPTAGMIMMTIQTMYRSLKTFKII